jgi:RNA polymerase sigma-54 factor
MSITQSLVQSQNQSLKMTDAMSLSLKVMQMSSIELASFVNKELQENPILSEEEPEVQNSDLSFNNLKIRNYDYTFNVDDMMSEVSLHQKVAEQIELSKLDAKQRFIAYHLAEYLNSNGYIDCDPKLVADRLKCNIYEVEKVIINLQDFEPTGIFARNLSECLALQMQERGLLTKESKIVLDNLALVANNEFSKLAKITNISCNKVIDIVKIIKTLNPKPCSHLSYEKAYTRIPDIIISQTNNGDFAICFSSNNMAKIILNNDLYDKVKSKVSYKEDKKYLSEQYSRASNLLKAIEKRRESTLKTAIAIFEKQRSFFENGIMGLKPMTLSDIAREINMHESSISRITCGKYIETPFGIFEMKDFFTSKVTNDHGIDVSSARIKEILKAIISSESKEHIYSDEEISGELKKYQLTAARRTVAKYREELKIPSSALRKRKARNRQTLIS